jgi:hypothetical protein
MSSITQAIGNDHQQRHQGCHRNSSTGPHRELGNRGVGWSQQFVDSEEPDWREAIQQCAVHQHERSQADGNERQNEQKRNEQRYCHRLEGRRNPAKHTRGQQVDENSLQREKEQNGENRCSHDRDHMPHKRSRIHEPDHDNQDGVCGERKQKKNYTDGNGFREKQPPRGNRERVRMR